MEVEVIPNSDLVIKDCKCIKLVKIHDVSHYYLTLVNKGGRCKKCGKYTLKVKELKDKTIVHDKNVIIHYKARRLICDCGSSFYEANLFTDEVSQLNH